MDLRPAPLEVLHVNLLLELRPPLVAAVVCEVVVPRCMPRWRLAKARDLANRRVEEDETDALERTVWQPLPKRRDPALGECLAIAAEAVQHHHRGAVSASRLHDVRLRQLDGN